jgi:hypothetical protein
MECTERPRVGEIIEIEPIVGLPPAGTYRVDACTESTILLSCGKIRLGADRVLIKITKRNLPEPASWLEQEIQFLTEQAAQCDCPDCRRLLKKRLRRQRRQKTVQ